MTINKRYKISNDIVIFVLNGSQRSQFNLPNTFAGVCATLNVLSPQDAMAVSSLVISYFADHDPRLAHEFIAYLAKEN